MSQNRSPVSRFEDALQGIVEGVFGRIFRTRLQPVELSRKLERAMEENLVVSAGRQVAPNAYRLTVSEADYIRFQQFLRTLLLQLQGRLIEVARQRGYTLTTKPVVKLESDPRLGTGDARVEATLLEPVQLNSFAGTVNAASGPDGAASALAGNAPDATHVIPNQPTDQNAPPIEVTVNNALPYAAMVLRNPQGPGQTYPLNREVIHIGRHTSNDIVINERRVSRFHAEIRFERGQFVLYDLGSLNGVSVNGTLTRQTVLRNGDVVVLGSYSFVFERR